MEKILKNGFWKKAAGLLFLGLLLTAVGLQAALAAPQPQRIDGVPLGKCAACHGAEAVLPEGHPPTEKMDFPQCVACHQKDAGEKPASLRGKLPLSHSHELSGVPCAGCHGTAKPTTAPAEEKCLSCHGNYKEKSGWADKSTSDPHKSHMGELECGLCHHQHKKSENFCGQCHWWKYRLP